MVKFAIDMFGDAADRFEAAQAEVLQEWQPSCGCDAPGLRPTCRTCPDCHQLRLLTQMKLSATPEKVFPAALPPPQAAYPHPLDIREKALEMYAQGHLLSEIQAATGVGDRHTIRGWARAAGLSSRLVIYPVEIRENCLRLYQSGMQPSQIEALTGVPADTIRGWVHDTGIIRKVGHSAVTRAQCLALYQQGKTPTEIQKLTQVPVSAIRRWVATVKISREPGSPRKHSQAIRDYCFQLRKEGKDYREIESLSGVSESTVRGWIKQQATLGNGEGW
jgi:transposase